METANENFKQNPPNKFLNLPPPDRSIMMQSPPPSKEPSITSFEAEDAPYKAGPIDFMPEAGMKGNLSFKGNNMNAPTIIIESE